MSGSLVELSVVYVLESSVTISYWTGQITVDLLAGQAFCSSLEGSMARWCHMKELRWGKCKEGESSDKMIMECSKDGFLVY